MSDVDTDCKHCNTLMMSSPQKCKFSYYLPTSLLMESQVNFRSFVPNNVREFSLLGELVL